MRPARCGVWFVSAVAVFLVLAGCAAPAGPAALSPTASGSASASADAVETTAATPTPTPTPTATEIAPPDHAPEGVEIDPVTGAWVYSDKVAFLDLPQDPDDFLSEPLSSLPELPPIDSLDGQQLADANGLVDLWDLQQFYIAACMADAGFEWRWVYYDPQFEGSVPDAEGHVIPGTWDDPTPGFDDALWGENNYMSPDYDENYVYHWSTAGCHGYAVHVTGQDDAN